jgi:hypothetical protein
MAIMKNKLSYSPTHGPEESFHLILTAASFLKENVSEDGLGLHRGLDNLQTLQNMPNGHVYVNDLCAPANQEVMLMHKKIL